MGNLFDDASVIAPRPETSRPGVVDATALVLTVLLGAVDLHRLSREEVGEVLRRVWYEVFQR